MRLIYSTAASKVSVVCRIMQNFIFIRRVPPYHLFFFWKRKIFVIDVIFSAYITLHYKVSVVLLYLNHSKLGELSLLMS